jgi:hypothetical protein
MSIELLRSLVWLDYRLAVLFTVILPLGLTIWALFKRVPSIVHLLMIYWRVSSLLAISVYLMAAQMPISFATGLLALVLIPLCLWFWVDLNEEIADRRGNLKLAFTTWRWGTTLYCVLALLLQIPYITCGFAQGAISTPTCQVWLEPSILFQQMFHAGSRSATLGFLASGALILYLFYLCYFVLLKLPKQGRSATGL